MSRLRNAFAGSQPISSRTTELAVTALDTAVMRPGPPSTPLASDDIRRPTSVIEKLAAQYESRRSCGVVVKLSG